MTYEAILAFLTVKFGAKAAVAIITSLTIFQIMTLGAIGGPLTVALALLCSYLVALKGFFLFCSI